jgi:bis(5'-nucleosyl)-tetraphosphatase (symmetrical)
MATYAIGDVQGCMASLERLLAALPLRDDDRIWLVGDLVNRGPRSLDVLRWAIAAGDRVVSVLGNHDLHLLARAAGAPAKKRDTLDDVLGAPDRDALIDWLRARPLVHVEGARVLVHAGLHPRWSAHDALARASELEAALRGDGWRAWIAQQAGSKAPAWRDELAGAARDRAILSWLVRARMAAPDGALDQDFDGAPAEAPRGLVPWFALPDPAWGDHEVVFGHWAALGLDLGPRHLALDTGCVWGNRLTAVRLDDRAVFQVKAVETHS